MRATTYLLYERTETVSNRIRTECRPAGARARSMEGPPRQIPSIVGVTGPRGIIPPFRRYGRSVSEEPSDPGLSPDRLLEAARPALAEALGETIEQIRAAVAAEAQSHLEQAIRDKHAELEARFADEADEERARLRQESRRWRALAKFQHKTGESTSQLEVLRRFLKTALRFADGSAVYLNKAAGLTLWDSEGAPRVFPDVVAVDAIDPDWYFWPVVVRGRTLGAVAAAGVRDRDALVIMGGALNRTIENLAMRLRFPEPADNVPSAQDPQPGAVAEAEAAATPGDVAPPAAGDPRQVARTIVVEIKLRHEDAVREGRARSDLFERLRQPIEEGRAAYEGQLSGRPEHDYFHEEIVKILADNDFSRMGPEYPGPVVQSPPPLDAEEANV